MNIKQAYKKMIQAHRVYRGTKTIGDWDICLHWANGNTSLADKFYAIADASPDMLAVKAKRMANGGKLTKIEGYNRMILGVR